MLNRYDRFDYGIVYPLPYNLHVNACFLKMRLQGAQWPLVTMVSFQDWFVLREIVRLLIDAIVRQVLIQILLCSGCVRVVGLRCKPSESFIVNVYAKRINAGDEDVYSEVELVIVDQQWIWNVFTDYSPIFFEVQLIQVVNQIDTFALRALGGFHDP